MPLFPTGRYAPSEGLLYSALAAYQLLWCGLSLLQDRFEFDCIGAVVAPGFLATRAVPQLASRISPWDTAAALFGYYLARDLPVRRASLSQTALTSAVEAGPLLWCCARHLWHGAPP